MVDLLMARDSRAKQHVGAEAGSTGRGAVDTEAQMLGPVSADSDSASQPAGADPRNSVTTGWFGRTLFATGLVIGLAILLRTGVRRISARGGGLASQLGAGGRAPSGLLMVLGRFPIARGQTLVLLKIDRRVLLLCQGPSGFQTLTEITDPEEVASLLVKSRDEEGESLASRFTSMLHRAERDPSICGNLLHEVAESGTTTVADDDNWAVRERLGQAAHREPGDPLSVLRRRLQSIHGGAV